MSFGGAKGIAMAEKDVGNGATHRAAEKEAMMTEPDQSLSDADNRPDQSLSDADNIPDQSLSDADNRVVWANQAEYLLSCIGTCVGLGNIWRFPYLCMRNGGGAFLVPYLLFLALFGIPLCFLEMTLGQFSGQGIISVYRICPLLQGIGWGSLIFAVFGLLWNLSVTTWILYYLGMSLRSELPWNSCNNTWNTDNCVVPGSEEGVYVHHNVSGTNLTRSTSHNVTLQDQATVMASEEFFRYKMLDISDGIDDVGYIKWDLLLCLLAIIILTFICVFRGIKSVGKAVYITCTVPYILLTVLLIRGVTLPGSMLGIKYYIVPQWHKLLNFKVWIDASVQIMFSVGLGMGNIINYSSFSKFHNNCVRDTLIVTLLNSGTSLYGGFALFSVVGYMSYRTGVPIENVAIQGPGLAFVAYPEAMAKLPLPPLWSTFFFTTLLMMGIGSVIGNFEAVSHGLMSLFPTLLLKRKLHFTVCMCAVFFVAQLPIVTRGGMYIYVLLDWFAFSVALVPLCLGEVLVVVYIYGIGRYYRDLQMIFGRQPSLIWAVTWACITPIILLTLFVVTSLGLGTPVYGDYVYPGWSVAVGWLMAIVGLVPLPVVALYYVITSRGSLYQRLVSTARPAATWGPSERRLRAAYSGNSERHWSVRMRFGGKATESSASTEDTDLNNHNMKLFV